MQQTKISLIVQPGDSFFPVVSAIDKAETSINITVFRLDDPIIQEALYSAHRRGVRVRALVATSARGWEERNRQLLKAAKKVGLEIQEPAGDSKKSRFHYKVMTVDGRQSLIFTFNPTRENLHYTRDFGVIAYSQQIAEELNRLFNADWNNSSFAPTEGSNVFVSPYNSRKKMMALLEGAKTSIHIWDAKLNDPAIVSLLRMKAASGVDVRVLGEDEAALKSSSKIGFREITRFKLHAKCVIVDQERAAIGSMNLRTECFDARREVGIVIDEPSAVKHLESVFKSDWEHKPVTSAMAQTQLGRPDVIKAAVEPTEEGFVLISRTDALRRHSLREGISTVGRADESDVVIPDALVSRHHARINVAAGRYSITDLDSSNGTFVNGQRVVGTQDIAPGDILSFAEVEEFRFVEL
jgi:phosphatidylserine/phosphatidylglycerophosphate/cardiolipin synthase-like enzyme